MNPFARIGCARQTTFFVPRRDWQSQENFILHQLNHIQFACHRQEIPGVVFQLILRQVGTFRNKFQQAVDIELMRNGVQAALTGQRDNSRNLQMQHVLSARPLRPLQMEAYLSLHLGQQIMQTLKNRDRQRSVKNTAFSSKNKSV